MPKRIIGGVTYNTDTSTAVARSFIDGDHFREHRDITLYLTRSGAFFLDVYDRDKERRYFQAMSRDEAEEWIMGGEVELLDEHVFSPPPEAEAQELEKAEATLFVRVPVSLRNRIAKAAEAEKLSVNAWMIRCAERCLADA